MKKYLALLLLFVCSSVTCVKWGGQWRMPTKAEFDELIENCTWTWTTINNVICTIHMVAITPVHSILSIPVLIITWASVQEINM